MYIIQSVCTMHFYVFYVILCLHVFTRTHAHVTALDTLDVGLPRAQCGACKRVARITERLAHGAESCGGIVEADRLTWR